MSKETPRKGLYPQFPAGKLPPSADKGKYNTYPFKSSAADFATNTLPLISGPFVVVVVVEKTRKENEGVLAMTETGDSANEKEIMRANTSESDTSYSCDAKEYKAGLLVSGNIQATHETIEKPKPQSANDNKNRGLASYLGAFQITRMPTHYKDRKPVSPEEFSISLPLLQARSPYWANLLKETQTTTEPLEVKSIPGIVSPQSVAMLFHWWYREDLVWSDLESHHKNDVSNMIELAHLMEHWQSHDPNLELYITSAVKHIVTKYGKHYNYKFFSDEHIESIFSLRHGHSLQDLLVMAAIEPYFGKDERGYVPKILNKPGGAEWLLQWVHITLNSISVLGDNTPNFKDPFSGHWFNILPEAKRY
ncbi:hypothetical protein HYFRA_00004027 [Hymenoscyphus fraxineus]|uniref:BTB domain-containing protein n=1 Tax=Hymenoscyphus fraxineus TaxID=746836 RepID=A0A9N9KL38_9HELO|nr:hypothetical protein HYFRA_00004027 [Hymenoscyphus fraxineus]